MAAKDFVLRSQPPEAGLLEPRSHPRKVKAGQARAGI